MVKWQYLFQFEGEESVEYDGDLGVDYKSFKVDFLNPELFQGVENKKISLEECVVWIDPLDGTKDFVNGIILYL